MTFSAVARGLLFPEGPVWLPDGSVVLVEMFRPALTQVTPQGRRRVIAMIPGGPNGIARGPDGFFYVCNNGGSMYAVLEGDGRPGLAWSGPDRYIGGSIQVVDLHTGSVRSLYDACDGVALESPNDIVFDAHGGFYFSDFGYMHDGRTPRCAVYYATTDGRSIRAVHTDTFSPNGIGLSPDGTTLYWAETMPRRLLQAELTAPGAIRPDSVRVLYTFPAGTALDSLAVDHMGNIWVAVLGAGAVAVVSPTGTLLAQYPTGDTATTNVCFGGVDDELVFVTAANTGQLLQMRNPFAVRQG